MAFLLSYNGLGALLATLILVIILTGIDVNSFIIMSALVQEGKIEMTARHMLSLGIRSIKQFFSPTGLLLILYISLIVPLIGVGVTISPMKEFQIPNFITSVIYSNPFYLMLYSVFIIGLIYLTFRLLFVIHYILILDYHPLDAIKASFKLTKISKIKFLKDVIINLVKYTIWLYLPLGIVLSIVSFILVQLENGIADDRFSLLFVFITLSELLALAAMILVPTLILTVTDLFYQYNQARGITVRLKMSNNAKSWMANIKYKIRLRTKLLISFLIVFTIIVNLVLAAFLTLFFEPIFKTNHPIQVISHRAGGDLGAENTVEGIKKAAKEEVAWAEIDVQRTKDCAYILNHDRTFKRLTGDSRMSSEMTLSEIKQLQVKNAFDRNQPAQPVPTIQKVIKASKNKIGLFIELKGKTADRKMVDDIVKLIKKEKIENQAVLLSLDYNLIKYIEEVYPEIDSGYLYYFAIGKTDQLVGDYLIMEEREATPEKIDKLKSKGKKVIVWTVNTPESIENFVNSEVDGIITDNVRAVKDGLKNRDHRTDLDVILDNILG